MKNSRQELMGLSRGAFSRRWETTLEGREFSSTRLYAPLRLLRIHKKSSVFSNLQLLRLERSMELNLDDISIRSKKRETNSEHEMTNRCRVKIEHYPPTCFTRGNNLEF